MMVNSDQVKFIGMVQPVETSVGILDQMVPPWEFAETPAEIQRPAPRLGEHTAEVLGEAGFSAQEIAGFRTRGALAPA
jgi:crotonobetainyl-CoA:carnitine CoA-transferase CaiB-like acyl-CoA transferase